MTFLLPLGVKGLRVCSFFRVSYISFSVVFLSDIYLINYTNVWRLKICPPLKGFADNQDCVCNVNTSIDVAWKVSVIGVFMVHIFPHSDWIRRSGRKWENADQKNFKYGHFFSSNRWGSFPKCKQAELNWNHDTLQLWAEQPQLSGRNVVKSFLCLTILWSPDLNCLKNWTWFFLLKCIVKSGQFPHFK